MKKNLLITCIDFNNKSGNGITLSNIFSNWEKDDIYVAHDKISPYSVNKAYKCFNLKTNKEILPELINIIEEKTVLKQTKKSNFIRMFFSILFIRYKHLLLFCKILKKYPLKKEFIQWFAENKIMHVYAMPHKVEHILFLHDLIKVFPETKLYIHLVDDLPSIKKIGFTRLFDYLFKLKLKNLFQKAEKNFVISELMAIEYKKRYASDFVKLHNPGYFKQCPVKHINNKIDILFTGTVEPYNINEIEYIDKAIIELKNTISDFSFSLTLCGSVRNTALIERINKLKATKHTGFIDYNKIMETICHYDVLFLPMAFEKKKSKNIRLSLPSKLSEYLSSGKIILIFAPENTALMYESMKYDYGYRITEFSILKIKEQLTLIYNELKSGVNTRAQEQNMIAYQNKESNFFNFNDI